MFYFVIWSFQAIAQLSTLRVARSESLVCLEAMCSRRSAEKHFLRLLEHLPEMVQNVKQALAQVNPHPFAVVDVVSFWIGCQSTASDRVDVYMRALCV